jgi:transposase
VALSRLLLAVPYYRLSYYQSLLGVPLPDATQWELVKAVALAARPVFEQLCVYAAQCPLLYQDDTWVRVLSLLKENRSHASPERTGMFTSALIGCEGERSVVLYFSGRAHAGENLQALLALRAPERAAPLVMSDALAANQIQGLPEHIRCLCLAHGLRQFSELETHFPQGCKPVLDTLGKIFEHDARTLELDPEQRLAYHREHSQPLMETLHTWLSEQMQAREVEPNSSLGKAYHYLLKHWQGLTEFLRTPGAPLDSNWVERALKRMILQRKNSLFFKSAESAQLASVLLSVIVTCREAGVNVFDYLCALLRQREQVAREPARWLPWGEWATA